MPVSYSNIAGQEPSTVTFRVGTVVIPRGSTNEQQEILVIGDPQTSNALARVIASPPASTEFGAAVRIVSGPSSVADLAVRAVLSSTSADNPVNAAQVGSWTVRANISSTATDNPVSAAQAGTWTVRANVSSTSTDNPVAASQAGSWTVRANLSSTSADNPVNAVQSGAWTVRATLSSTNTDNPTLARQGVGNSSGADAWPTLTVDSSNAIVKPGDSANNAIRVNVVAGAAGGSTVVTVSELQSIKPTWGTKSSVTVTLASLGNTNRRETTAFFSTSYRDYKIRVNTKGTSASSGFLNIYVYEGLGDTTYTGTATGTDASFSTSVLLSQVRFLGAMQLTTSATPCIQVFNLSDVMVAPPSRGGLIFDNQTGGTLSSTSADHDVTYQGLT